MNQNITQAQVEERLGTLESWLDEPNAISFRPAFSMTFQDLQWLADLFGTDRIDINTGHQQEESEDFSTEAGEVTVYK